MKIAVIKTGGKQYVVTDGKTLRVEKLSAKPDEIVKLDTLLTTDGDSVTIGQPTVTSAVTAKVITHGVGEKIHVVKFKNKIRYRRNRGHRQQYTTIAIEKI